MTESFDIKNWYSVWAITAIESKNQVVIFGRRDILGPLSLYMFQNNPDGQLVETQMDAPCQHYGSYTILISMVQNGKELLAVSCCECSDIKLIDMDTKQITPVFKSPTDPLVGMCSGPNGGLFVVMSSGNVQQLDSSFSIINMFHLSSFINDPFSFYFLCYLPAPHNTFVFYFKSKLRGVSLQNGHQVWSQPWNWFTPHCLLYCAPQEILLAGVLFEPKAYVVNPSNGSVIQTIQIPDVRWIDEMCLCNDQIVMAQWSGKDSSRHVLSYYSLNRIV